MSCATKVREHIMKLPFTEVFVTRDFLSYGPRDSVDQALWRLVSQGVIFRVARGVFVRDCTYQPSRLAIAKAKARAFNKSLVVHANDLAENFGMTVNKNLRSIFSTDGSRSSFKAFGFRIYTEHLCARKMHLSNSKAKEAIRVLWQIGEKNISYLKISAVMRDLTREECEEVVRNVALMPRWLSNWFFAHSQLRQMVGASS